MEQEMQQEICHCLTPDGMRALEAAAIGSGAVTASGLMARAGAGVVATVLERWPEQPRVAVILAGPGNNGGDGAVIARRLRALGWEVRLLTMGTPAPNSLAAEMLAAWQGENVSLGAQSLSQIPHDALVIDALFGTGLTRPLQGAARDAALWRAGEGAAHRLLAIDAPSGLCLERGVALGGIALRADLTVAFQTAKCGHLLAEGPALCGALTLADLGLAPWFDATKGQCLRLVQPPTAPDLDKQAGHKFDHGHLLVLGGGPGQGGAARLAARAALRIGAGLVTLGCPQAALPENAARLDAIMLHSIERAADLTARLRDPRITALCLGPGLGLDARAAGLVAAALAAHRPTVLDADALTLIAQDPDLRAALHPDCLLTPHIGEFARLAPDLAEALTARAKPELAQEAARRLGAPLLLKGHDTLIATPQGDRALHSASYAHAAPWLATAGSGDVLAGCAAGLMARGGAVAKSAEIAAWCHAAAARAFGPGLIAEDLPETLPRILAARIALK